MARDTILELGVLGLSRRERGRRKIEAKGRKKREEKKKEGGRRRKDERRKEERKAGKEEGKEEERVGGRKAQSGMHIQLPLTKPTFSLVFLHDLPRQPCLPVVPGNHRSC